jgi:hypothetical protein
LKSLKNIRPLYFLPNEPLADEVLTPGFRVAEQVDCIGGYFSSDVLVSLAPGLATFIARSKNIFRLIISPLLRPDDLAVIEEGKLAEKFYLLAPWMIRWSEFVAQHSRDEGAALPLSLLKKTGGKSEPGGSA